MPRLPRLSLPGIPLLIRQSGHNRLPCFVDGDDYLRFVSLLADGCRRCGVSLHAYVLVPAAYYLLITPPEAASAARLVQLIGARFVRDANARHGRSGTLWSGRYQASPVEPVSGELGQVLGYMATRPVSAGLVPSAGEWPWSSFALHAGRLPGSPLAPLPGHAATPAQQGPVELQSQRIEKALMGGGYLGGQQFRRHLESGAGVSLGALRRGRPPGVPRRVRG